MHDLHHSFPGQRADEPIFIFLRRHPVSFLYNAIIFSTMIAIGIIFYIGLFFIDFFDNKAFFNLGVLLINSYLLASLAFFLVAILDFYFDIHIVTNTRIVDIDQNRLFHRQIDELALEDIEDVSTVVKGLLGTFFYFGNVEIQTAGTKPNFVFEDVPKPREVAQLTLDLANQAKRGINLDDRLPRNNIYGIIGNSIIDNPDRMIALGAWPNHR